MAQQQDLQLIADALEAGETVIAPAEQLDADALAKLEHVLADVAVVKRHDEYIVFSPKDAAEPVAAEADGEELSQADLDLYQFAPNKAVIATGLLSVQLSQQLAQPVDGWRIAGPAQTISAGAVVQLEWKKRRRRVRASLSQLGFHVSPANGSGYWIDEVRVVLTPECGPGVTYFGAGPPLHLSVAPGFHAASASRSNGWQVGLGAPLGPASLNVGYSWDSTRQAHTQFADCSLSAQLATYGSNEVHMVWKLGSWFGSDGMPAPYPYQSPRTHAQGPQYPFFFADGVSAGLSLHQAQLANCFAEWDVPESVYFNSSAKWRCKVLVQARQWRVSAVRGAVSITQPLRVEKTRSINSVK